KQALVFVNGKSVRVLQRDDRYGILRPHGSERRLYNVIEKLEKETLSTIFGAEY
ncbi:13193_t:CDS:2, partial [Funneliformis mosseae]